jgi:hypothetical protein
VAVGLSTTTQGWPQGMLPGEHVRTQPSRRHVCRQHDGCAPALELLQAQAGVLRVVLVCGTCSHVLWYLCVWYLRSLVLWYLCVALVLVCGTRSDMWHLWVAPDHNELLTLVQTQHGRLFRHQQPKDSACQTTVATCGKTASNRQQPPHLPATAFHCSLVPRRQHLPYCCYVQKENKPRKHCFCQSQIMAKLLEM